MNKPMKESTIPWTKYITATGKTAEMNRIVQGLCDQLVNAGGWPKTVVIGKDWIDPELEAKHGPLKSFWLGSVGVNASVFIVEGDRLEVSGDSILTLKFRQGLADGTIKVRPPGRY